MKHAWLLHLRVKVRVRFLRNINNFLQKEIFISFEVQDTAVPGINLHLNFIKYVCIWKEFSIEMAWMQKFDICKGQFCSICIECRRSRSLTSISRNLDKRPSQVFFERLEMVAIKGLTANFWPLSFRVSPVCNSLPKISACPSWSCTETWYAQNCCVQARLDLFKSTHWPFKDSLSKASIDCSHTIWLPLRISAQRGLFSSAGHRNLQWSSSSCFPWFLSSAPGSVPDISMSNVAA